MKLETVVTIHEERESNLGWYWVLRLCDIDCFPWKKKKEFARSDLYFDTAEDAAKECGELFSNLQGTVVIQIAIVGEADPETIEDVPRLFHAKAKRERVDVDG